MTVPHAYGTFLGVGHTIPNGDPPEPYGPGTKLCCALIAPPLMIPDGAERLELDDGPLHFYGVIGLHRQEMELKLAGGMDELADHLDAADISEVLDPGRPSSVKRKRFGLF